MSANSQAAIVTLASDKVAPTVLSAGAIKGASKVGLAFSELLDKTSAETAGNYTVTGGTVTTAALHFGKYVELTLSGAINAASSVTVKGVKDLAGNAISSASATAELNDMKSEDVGTPGTDPLQPDMPLPSAVTLTSLRVAGMTSGTMPMGSTSSIRNSRARSTCARVLRP